MNAVLAENTYENSDADLKAQKRSKKRFGEEGRDVTGIGVAGTDDTARLGTFWP